MRKKGWLKFLLSILILFLIVIGGISLYRYKEINKMYDEHKIITLNGVDEEISVEIGGIKQYLNIRGEDKENPIILYLHGGPGMPMTPMIYTYQYDWERDYTIVNWDQRNSGKTYLLNEDNAEEISKELSTDVLVNDIKEIAEYLTNRFNKEKIIIMGDSFGSIIGSKFVHKYPELTEAYVGSSQIVDAYDGVSSMASYVRSIALENNESNDVKTLDDFIEVVENRNFNLGEKINDLNEVAGKYVKIDDFQPEFIKMSLLSPYVSLKDFMYYPKVEKLWSNINDELKSLDLRKMGKAYEVPIIYIMGENDLRTNILTKEYFDSLEAPYKKYIALKGMGHEILLNDSEAFYEAFNESLKEYK